MATESALGLLPLPAADFPAWRAAVRDRLAGLRAASGSMSRAQAGALAEGILARLLPAGPQTPDHHLWLIVDDAGADQPGADQPGAEKAGAGKAGAAKGGFGKAAVGHLWLRVRTVSDGVEAFVFDLWVTPDADARGLGRPALLLAEQTARELGAGVLRLNISRLDAMTMRMIDGLGYEPTASQMILDLPPEAAPVDGGPDEAGPGEAALDEAGGVEADGVELRPMTPAQFDAFCATQVAGYAADIERSGSASAAEAQEKAVADFAELLPDGLRSPGQLLWMAYAGGDDGPADHVGWLWLQVRADPGDADPTQADSDTDTDTGAPRAFILDIEVRPEFRRRGHARSIMRGAEREARDRGAVSIGLSVFGDNHGARALYDSLGYRPTEELLRTVL